MDDRYTSRVEEREAQDRPAIQLGMGLGVPFPEEPLQGFRSAEIVVDGARP
jgi:hypothetical protein